VVLIAVKGAASAIDLLIGVSATVSFDPSEKA
jgi:hypothetical protein